MSAWGGFITKPPIHHKNTRKVSHHLATASRFELMVLYNVTSGKYLLEREKLVKENAWKLDSD
jgi:hypothetical protein